MVEMKAIDTVELKDELDKLDGKKPYDGPENVCRNDAYFAKSLETKYGFPMAELRHLSRDANRRRLREKREARTGTREEQAKAAKEVFEPWTLEAAVDFVRELEPFLATAGWHGGMAGSVLMKGSSTNDLDLLVYPHDSNERSYSRLCRALETFGMTLKFTRKQVQFHWIRNKSHDQKHVEVWLHEGRRIDIFLMG